MIKCLITWTIVNRLVGKKIQVKVVPSTSLWSEACRKPVTELSESKVGKFKKNPELNDKPILPGADRADPNQTKHVNTNLTFKSLINSFDFYGKWFIRLEPRMQHFGRTNLANLFNIWFNKSSGSISFLCLPSAHQPLVLCVINPQTMNCGSLKAPWDIRSHVCCTISSCSLLNYLWFKGAKVYRNTLHFFVEQSLWNDTR